MRSKGRQRFLPDSAAPESDSMLDCWERRMKKATLITTIGLVLGSRGFSDQLGLEARNLYLVRQRSKCTR